MDTTGFYLSKLLPLFVLPVGVTLILLIGGIVLRRRWMLITAAALLWLSSMPLARLPNAQGWVTAPRAGWGTTRAGLGALSPDPWGNCYVVNLVAANSSGMAVWALSAGPDGIIETPFDASSDAPAGDDVRIRIR